jgi:hypothetical protein
MSASEAKKFLNLGRELQASQSRIKMSTDEEDDYKYVGVKDGSGSLSQKFDHRRIKELIDTPDMSKGDLLGKKSGMDSSIKVGPFEQNDKVFSLPTQEKSPPGSPRLTNAVLNLQMSGAAINITPREKERLGKLVLHSANRSTEMHNATGLSGA